jgi:pentatricopeptide repeat protein
MFSLLLHRKPQFAIRRIWDHHMKLTRSFSSGDTSRIGGNNADKASSHTQLKDWYRDYHGKNVIIESAFEVEDHFQDGVVWFTARFICPVTKQVYEAGTLNDHSVIESTGETRSDINSILLVNDKVFYQRLEQAIQAAAARRLDAIENLSVDRSNNDIQNVLSDELATNTFSQDNSGISISETLTAETLTAETLTEETLTAEALREENLTAESLKVEAVIADTVTAQTLTAQTEIVETSPFEDIDKKEEEKRVQSSAASKPESKNDDLPILSFDPNVPPKHILDSYYSMMNIPSNKYNFDSILHNEYDEHGRSSVWWTSSFVCPLSEKRYQSGSLRDENKYGTILYVNNVPYYRRLKWAIHAAAGRALDDINFRSLAKTDLHMFCHDDPSSCDAASVQSEAEERQGEDNDEPSDIGLTVLTEDSSVVPNELPEVDVLIPQTAPHMVSRNTLERVMDAWMSGVHLSHSTMREVGLIIMSDPSWHKKKLMKEAESWWVTMFKAEVEKKSVFYFKTFQRSFNLDNNAVVKAVLATLAKANQIENNDDVYSLALKVLQSLPNDNKPDPEVIRAFMQCLSGTPEKMAFSAEELLNCMITNKPYAGYYLQKPTLETFNTVIMLWAQCGKTEKCRELVRLMESNDIQANYDTFHTVLLSCALVEFDKKLVIEIIDTMKSVNLCNANIYSVPLRWSGKKVGSKLIPWDDYSVIFRNGFVPSAERKTTVAKNIEDWVIGMESDPDIPVDIGCYEAVIQGWLRTGTQEGLERAETWAVALLEQDSHGITPSLKTFFPIFASLAEVGTSNPKLYQWMKQVENRFDFVPDGRLASLRILARKKEAALISNESNTIDALKASSHEAAKELTLLCEQVLNHCSDSTKPQVFVEASVFCDVIFCLGTLGQHSLKNGKVNDAKEAIAMMIKIIEDYHSLLFSLYQHCVPEEDQDDYVFSLEETKFPTLSSFMSEMQLGHLLQGASCVFNSFIRWSNQIESECNRPNLVNYATEFSILGNLPTVEALLRRIQEYKRVLRQGEFTHDDFQLHYSDGFSYLGNSKEFAATNMDFCAAVVDSLAKAETDHLLGDQARVLELILDIILDDYQVHSDLKRLQGTLLKIFTVLKVVKSMNIRSSLSDHFLMKIMKKGDLEFESQMQMNLQIEAGIKPDSRNHSSHLKASNNRSLWTKRDRQKRSAGVVKKKTRYLQSRN